MRNIVKVAFGIISIFSVGHSTFGSEVANAGSPSMECGSTAQNEQASPSIREKLFGQFLSERYGNDVQEDFSQWLQQRVGEATRVESVKKDAPVQASTQGF